MAPEPPQTSPDSGWPLMIRAPRQPLRPPALPPKQYPWGNDPWPQATGDHETLAFTPAVFRRVARMLREDLARYKSTARHLAAAGRLQAADVGGWAAGQDLFATTQQTHASAVAVHDAFISTYEDLIHKLEQSAGRYDTAEDQIVQAIRRLEGPGMGPEPTRPASGPASQY